VITIKENKTRAIEFIRENLCNYLIKMKLKLCPEDKIAVLEQESKTQSKGTLKQRKTFLMLVSSDTKILRLWCIKSL